MSVGHIQFTTQILREGLAAATTEEVGSRLREHTLSSVFFRARGDSSSKCHTLLYCPSLSSYGLLLWQPLHHLYIKIPLAASCWREHASVNGYKVMIDGEISLIRGRDLSLQDHYLCHNLQNTHSHITCTCRHKHTHREWWKQSILSTIRCVSPRWELPGGCGLALCMCIYVHKYLHNICIWPHKYRSYVQYVYRWYMM